MPTKLFLTKGMGFHKDKLFSFELALRDAGIEKCNLIYVSSILPSSCDLISKKEGLELLSPGQMTFCVMSKNESNKKNELISAAIGISKPLKSDNFGYIYERSVRGNKAKLSGGISESMAVEMLATRINLPFNRAEFLKTKNNDKKNENIFSTHIFQLAKNNKDLSWVTVVAAAVFIIS